jgi:predicted RNase H-like nuclease (RuvC/YqgF family)
MSELGQHNGNGIRYTMHLSAPKGGVAQMLRSPEGGWVSWEDYARLKAEVERLTKQNALATPRHLIASQDIKTLREQIEELKLENSQYEEHHKYGQNVITSLREEVERLTKAVASSPVAQAKLKELEGKTTFEEINPKDDNSNITTELLVLCNRQASDIRRLTKAGDAMQDDLKIQVWPWASQFKSIQQWNAAKKGRVL